MPIFNFVCSSCKQPTKRLLDKVSEVADKECRKALPNGGVCLGKLVHTPTGASSQVVERLDNGAMAKVLERYADAEVVFKERKDARIREAKELRGEAPFEGDDL